MGLPIVFSQTLATAVATALVSAAGTVAAGVPFTLITTILDTQRRILFTPTGNESTNTFAIVGTNGAGNAITENLAGANATTFYSNLDFKTVSSITPKATTASTMSIGTNGVGSSLWQIVNWNTDPAGLEIGVEVRSGSGTYSVQYTLDDPNNLNNGGLGYPLPFNDLTLASVTTTQQTSFLSPVVAARLLTTAGTGTLYFRMLQAGLASP